MPVRFGIDPLVGGKGEPDRFLLPGVEWVAARRQLCGGRIPLSR